MKKGFTLIELLVVIVIIGILMSVLLVSYQGTRVTARDGKRKADLEQIRSALELYHADCGQYPASSLQFGTGSLTSNCPGASVTYMSRLPQDPIYPTYEYRYARGTLHTYNLCAYLEKGSGSVSGCGGNCGSAVCNYQVNQP
jgi:general secretion pathway protein G